MCLQKLDESVPIQQHGMKVYKTVPVQQNRMRLFKYQTSRINLSTTDGMTVYLTGTIEWDESVPYRYGTYNKIGQTHESVTVPTGRKECTKQLGDEEECAVDVGHARRGEKQVVVCSN